MRYPENRSRTFYLFDLWDKQLNLFTSEVSMAILIFVSCFENSQNPERDQRRGEIKESITYWKRQIALRRCLRRGNQL
jgi:hypothetical protein